MSSFDVASTLHANFVLLNVQDGQHEMTGTNPERMEIAIGESRKIIEKQSARSSRYANLQFKLLITGALLYIGWHVWEMWLRTN
jgi:hypothetical protein